MEFYRGVFGGDLTLSTFGEAGAAAPGDEDKIMHAQLETPAGHILMASDAPAGMPRDEGSSISISLSGDDGDELRGYFTKLSEGGSVAVPLEKQMWGDEFGMCVDRFGIQLDGQHRPGHRLTRASVTSPTRPRVNMTGPGPVP